MSAQRNLTIRCKALLSLGDTSRSMSGRQPVPIQERTQRYLIAWCVLDIVVGAWLAVEVIMSTPGHLNAAGICLLLLMLGILEFFLFRDLWENIRELRRRKQTR
jgi:hypothetical protein